MPPNKFDIRDEYGNKIGEAHRVPSAGEQAAGAVLFGYLLWKALPGLILLALIAICISVAVYAWQAGNNFVRYGTPDESQAKSRAQATGQASSNDTRIQMVDPLVSQGDYYLASIAALAVLARQPDNASAQRLFQSIQGRVQGGFVTRDGVYHPFDGSPVTRLIRNGQLELGAVSNDGRLAMARPWGEQGPSGYSLLDLSTGQFTPTKDAFPNPPFALWATADESTFGKPLVLAHLDGTTRENIGCVSPGSRNWSHDGRFLVTTREEKIAVVDAQIGTCNEIPIPKLRCCDGTGAITDGTHIWIVTPGEGYSLKKGAFFVMNFDGSGLKKIRDLDIEEIRDNHLLLSPDSSVIYLNQGLAISTRTGQTVSGLGEVVAWIDGTPSQTQLGEISVTINPPNGARGTVFKFAASGGVPGQDFTWGVEPDGNSGYIARFAQDGTFQDRYFEFSTGIDTTAGTHTLTLRQGSTILATATFDVTE